MENKIYRIITSEEYSTLLEKLEDKNFKAQELSNFLIIDNNERKHMKTYIAIDNTTGDLQRSYHKIWRYGLSFSHRSRRTHLRRKGRRSSSSRNPCFLQ